MTYLYVISLCVGLKRRKYLAAIQRPMCKDRWVGISIEEGPVVGEAVVALRTGFATVVVVVLDPDDHLGMVVSGGCRRDLVEEYSFSSPEIRLT
jgi:hypothetical protein